MTTMKWNPQSNFPENYRQKTDAVGSAYNRGDQKDREQGRAVKLAKILRRRCKGAERRFREHRIVPPRLRSRHRYR
jgi:hypothetical protein